MDKNYQSNIPGLYAAGEAAGVFGVYRPGGSVLNSTQVSSMRAALHIAKQKRTLFYDVKEEAKKRIAAIQIGAEENTVFLENLTRLQQKMSEYAAFSRNSAEITAMRQEVEYLLQTEYAVSEKQLPQYLKYKDFLFTMREMLSALQLWCAEIGARGSASAVNCEQIDQSGRMICTQNGQAFTEMPPAISNSEVWFETVYNQKEV